MRTTRIAAALLVLASGLLTAQQAPFSKDQVSTKLRELFYFLAARSRWLTEQRTRTARHVPTGT